MNDIRHLSALDHLLNGFQRALETVAGAPEPTRPSPARGIDEGNLEERERTHAAGLMRVNQTGEVCAQALYDGQSLLARNQETRSHLQHAAAEETDHLAWCNERLEQLQSRPSLLNPLWYAGSYLMGAGAALAGDRISMGFVVETERQVEAHLADHLQRLPAQDARSLAVLKQMQNDEARHAEQAQARGAVSLPFPVPGLMELASRAMKVVAYRI